MHVAGLDAVDGTPVLDIEPCTAEFGPTGGTVQPEWPVELMRDRRRRPVGRQARDHTTSPGRGQHPLGNVPAPPGSRAARPGVTRVSPAAVARSTATATAAAAVAVASCVRAWCPDMLVSPVECGRPGAVRTRPDKP
ncbi:hypothetical protein GCM10010266_19570 [Streptomyces griseomycini]|nr:hypothetical protein GCM10010266_19570 [Streptomyces griseomycini]GGR06282.1 hypothetical protein GCM10015536_08940 [Streptomyces griseomycini]